nr:MAG TPA: hypothetical protein [Caudoviricetes sp.]
MFVILHIRFSFRFGYVLIIEHLFDNCNPQIFPFFSKSNIQDFALKHYHPNISNKKTALSCANRIGRKPLHGNATVHLVSRYIVPCPVKICKILTGFLHPFFEVKYEKMHK